MARIAMDAAASGWTGPRTPWTAFPGTAGGHGRAEGRSGAASAGPVREVVAPGSTPAGRTRAGGWI